MAARSRSRSPILDQNEAAGLQHASGRDAPHFEVVPGQVLGTGQRYMVRKLIGEGTFGRVLSCVDFVRKTVVAVKVVKNVERYCDYAAAEAQILKEIAECDPERQSRCVLLLDEFLHGEYNYCLVFERLALSLYDFMHQTCERGLLVTDVRSIAQQLLGCISFLHGLTLTHTDLKCRNVMLRCPDYDFVPLPRTKGAMTRKPRSSEIVVIDFGGALFATERSTEVKVGTRHYRSPESILGLPWDEKVDCWAVGCLIAYTYLGFRPVTGSEDVSQLARMQRFLSSEIPKSMATGTLFSTSGRLEWPQRATSQETVDRVEATKPWRDQVASHHEGLVELVEGLMQFDPACRLSAETAATSIFVAGDKALFE